MRTIESWQNRCRRTAMVVALGLLGSPAAGLHAETPENEHEHASEEPSIVGCGKARAMERHFIAEQEASAGIGGVAEAMGETDVLHNQLSIEISNINTGANSCTLTGQNRMTIQSKSATLNNFTFRLRSQYAITSALINDITPVSVSTVSTATRSVTLDRTYTMDEVFTLTIAYTGNTFSIDDSIDATTHSGTAVVATLSEPYNAYTWWPTKDGDVGVPGDNSDKATLEFSITAPNNFSVASNGVRTSIVPLSGNRNQYNWETQYPIVPYLVSFAATNFNTWTKNYVHPGGTMPVEFFIYPENDTTPNRQSWERVTDMMAAFRPLFGEYPFINEKYGICNFSNFSGGMEHQTMTSQSGFSESLNSHELAHQWWGDNVTCETWCDIWLNEGFATYSEALWMEWKTGVQNPTAYFMAMNSRKPSSVNGSVYVPAAQTNNINRIFDSNFSYRKGAWVLHQLRHVVGDAMFYQILADYRAAYENSAATTDEFATLAEATFGADLTWFFDEWVYQIGAPAYRFGWGAVDVEGQTYLHAKIEQTQQPSYPNVFIMPVDLVATINGTPEAVSVWNNARTQRFVVPVSDTPAAVQFDPNQWILRTSLTGLTLVPGDMDGDNDVDGADFSLFEGCFTGSGVPASGSCEAGKLDADEDIDCADWSGFDYAWTAAGSAPELEVCALAPAPIPASSTWGLVTLGLLTLIGGTSILRGRQQLSD